MNKTSLVFPKLFAHFASLASLVYLVYSLNPNFFEFTFLQWIAITASIVSFIIAAKVEYNSTPSHQIHNYPRGSEKISNYMEQWLRRGGRCAIFTRDMTWANAPRLKHLLTQKARANELALFMPASNLLAEELRLAGADAYYYGNSGFVPRSRFTVVHWEARGWQVAIGRPKGEMHEIAEYNSELDPSTSVIEDLLEIVKLTARKADTPR